MQDQCAVSTTYSTRMVKDLSQIVKQQRLGQCLSPNSLGHSEYNTKKKLMEIQAERISRNANPLTLVAYCSTLSRNKGKEIVKLITLPSKLALKKEGDERTGFREISIYRKVRNKNVDTSSRTGNDRKTSSLGYNKKMMLCKQESKGIPLSAEQSKCLQDTNKEPDKQELEAHYMYMTKIQEVLHATDDNSGPTYDAEPFEKVDSNVIPDSSNMCDNERTVDQNAEEHEDERVLLASLIANLKLDFDENKKDSTTIKESKHDSYLGA
ncbi:hypothetical protein Tco_0693399 [Tanacetum coccineum]